MIENTNFDSHRIWHMTELRAETMQRIKANHLESCRGFYMKVNGNKRPSKKMELMTAAQNGTPSTVFSSLCTDQRPPLLSKEQARSLQSL